MYLILLNVFNVEYNYVLQLFLQISSHGAGVASTVVKCILK